MVIFLMWLTKRLEERSELFVLELGYVRIILFIIVFLCYFDCGIKLKENERR